MSKKVGTHLLKADGNKGGKSVAGKTGGPNKLPVNSPVKQIMRLHQGIGNRAVGRLIRSGTLQARLTVGKPDDVYEKEADQVADKVMSMPGPGALSSLENGDEQMQPKPVTEGITPLVRRQVEEEKEEARPKLQRQTGNVNPEVESNIESLKGGGQTIAGTARDFFEPRFGADFSGVRVHTGEKAGQMARAINARAFTTGKHIVFGKGEYSPGTTSGKRLLAHELSHVIQQNKNPKCYPDHVAKPFLQKKPKTPEMNEVIKRNRYQFSTTRIHYSRKAYFPVEGVGVNGKFTVSGSFNIRRTKNRTQWELSVGMIISSAASRKGNLVATGWVRLVTNGKVGNRVPLIYPEKSIHAHGDIPLSVRNNMILPRTGTVDLDIYVSTMLETPEGRAISYMNPTPERIRIYPKRTLT